MAGVETYSEWPTQDLVTAKEIEGRAANLPLIVHLIHSLQYPRATTGTYNPQGHTLEFAQRH